jgi:hypothetical protein
MGRGLPGIDVATARQPLKDAAERAGITEVRSRGPCWRARTAEPRRGLKRRGVPSPASPTTCAWSTRADGGLEAKKVGTFLIGLGAPSGKDTHRLPPTDGPVRPLPLAYESTEAEARFTNRFDPPGSCLGTPW